MSPPASAAAHSEPAVADLSGATLEPPEGAPRRWYNALLPVAAARQSVVSVLPQWAGRPPSMDEPEGSGVAVGDGTTVLTADHVLGDPVAVLVRTAEGEVLLLDISMPGPGLLQVLDTMMVGETNIDFAYALMPSVKGRTLLAMQPDDPAEVSYRLALLLYRRGDRDEAKRHVLAALEEAPRCRAAHRLLLEIVRP